MDFLDRHRTRATYRAVADAAGVPHRSLGGVRERCWKTSWAVNANTGEPTDYTEQQKNPDLRRTDEIITSVDDLIRRMKRES